MKIWHALALCAIVPALAGATAPDEMAPLSSYLMNPKAEIALARSAAPASISAHATIMVLTSHGYVAAINGDNGFRCFIDRPWAQPFDMMPFWSARMLAPTCMNPQASRSIFPYTIKRTAWALSGATKEQIMTRLSAAVASGALPTPEPGAMSYMMSKHQYLNDDGKAWFPHLMFYEPKSVAVDNGASWGANELLSPVVYDSDHKLNPEPWRLFFVPVTHWSDGTRAPLYDGK